MNGVHNIDLPAPFRYRTLCAPCIVQRKQQNMYHLRQQIRDRKGYGLPFEGRGLESLTDEALQSKCPEDGQNLLMYAAAQGNETWFLHLVDDIRLKVSMG